MVALVPPFKNIQIIFYYLLKKICASDYDQTPLNYYSERIQQIVIQCLAVNPLHRPDIYGVTQLCIEQLMLYTDRFMYENTISRKTFKTTRSTTRTLFFKNNNHNYNNNHFIIKDV